MYINLWAIVLSILISFFVTDTPVVDDNTKKIKDDTLSFLDSVPVTPQSLGTCVWVCVFVFVCVCMWGYL